MNRIIAGTMTWGTWGRNFTRNEMASLIQKCVDLGLITPTSMAAIPQKKPLVMDLNPVVSHAIRSYISQNVEFNILANSVH